MKKTILALALICGNAQAGFYTGNDLLQKIDSESHGDRMFSMGYVMGVFDLGQNILHCAPNGVTVGQIHDLTAAYIRGFPAKRHRAADSLITDALSAALPCPKKGTNL